MNNVYLNIKEHELRSVIKAINDYGEEIISVTFSPPLWNPNYGTKERTEYYTIFTRDKREVE